MHVHCKSILRLLSLILFVSTPSLPAAAFRWVHLGTIDAGLVNLAMDGKVAYRKMPPGKATPWGNIPPGTHKFQIGTETNPGAPFDLEISAGQKIVIVSVSDKNGDLQSRSIRVDAPKGEAFILNAMHGAMMTLQQSGQKAMFGKGFQIPISREKNTVTFTGSEGLKGEVIFSRLADAPLDPYLFILCGDEDDKPQLCIHRDRDSLFETSDETLEIPGELVAVVRIISQRNVPIPGSFDPMLVKWDEVDSQIFWLNLTIGRDPCRLEIGGFPAMRRLPAGRGSGFVKWPAGQWDTNVVVEPTNEKVGTSRFSLYPKSGLGLVSSGGGKFPQRLTTVEGRSRGETQTSAKPQIRFLNALPDGELRTLVKSATEPLAITMKAGEVSSVVPLVQGGFPGATLDLTVGNKKNQNILTIPAMPTLPPGDWVVIIHLDQESLATPVITWVEMDKGSITVPTGPSGDE
ncbi:MAG: hypothetical protein RLZZ505_3297 [Verrucomicrobiota bacterium]|jgi:hypothetical protein